MKKIGLLVSALFIVTLNAFAVRTTIPVQTVSPSTGLQSVTYTAADAANNHIVANDGNTQIIVINCDVAAKTVTIHSVPDENGRTGDIILIVPAASGSVCALGMSPRLPPALFSQQNSDAGSVYVDVSAATNLKLAAVHVN